MLGVPELRLPALEPHPGAALAEVAPRAPAGEQAIAAPADVTAVVDDQREAPHAGRRPLGQVVEARDGVAAVGAGLDHHLARARRGPQADAALERPGRRDGGPGDRAIRVGVEHDAVVRARADRPDGPNRGARRTAPARSSARRPPRRAMAASSSAQRPRRRVRTQPAGPSDGTARGGPRRFDRSVGSCYLVSPHLMKSRGSAVGSARVRPACYQRIPPLANSFDMIKCGRCGNANAGGRRSSASSVGPGWPPSALPEPAAVERPCRRLEPATDRLSRRSPANARAPDRCGCRSTCPRSVPGRARWRRPSGSAQQQAGFRLVVVHRDGTDGITYNLLGDQIDIGRTEGDLLFEDPHLAPRHARIVASLTGRVLTPLETRNGIYVRLRGPDRPPGRRLHPARQAGAALRARPRRRAERCARRIEHGVVVFGTPVRPPWARLRQVTPAAVSRDVFHLTRPEVVLGRESGDIVFSDDEFMSRRHAQIVVPQRPRPPGGPGQLERHLLASPRTARPRLR